MGGLFGVNGVEREGIDEYMWSRWRNFFTWSLIGGSLVFTLPSA